MNWLLDSDDDRVRAALVWSRDICGAKAGVLCRNPMGGALAGRVVHFGRLLDRRKP